MNDRNTRTMSWRRIIGKGKSFPLANSEMPLRAELFTLDQLEHHAKVIAAAHQLAEGRFSESLLPRLAENEQFLISIHDNITAAVARNRQITPASEWLLDNFYLIEEQIRSTKRLLPRSYSKELPRLSNGPAAKFPRVYAIALDLIRHTDGRLDSNVLNGFIASYQSVKPLKLGELWALPLMLRLALIENLRRVSGRIDEGLAQRELATDWAERMIKTVDQSPTDLILVLADMARANPPLSSAFVAELTRHLQGQNPNFAFANSWLEHRLHDQGQTIEQLVLDEGQFQAAEQVSVGNSISSLRFLSTNDWPNFVSKLSIVEQTLNADPANVYAKMDFATRNRYRHAVEAIARRSQVSEHEVARRAVRLAQSNGGPGQDPRSSHVGYYLIDRGRSALERLVNMRFTPGVVADKIRRRFPLFIYHSLIALLTISVTYFLYDSGGWRFESFGFRAFLAIPVLICASHLAISLANWFLSLLVKPEALPRMDFRHEIPRENRTLVVVPTMLSNRDTTQRLLEGLEIRYLANRNPHLHFGLLTDFDDAAQESMPDDAELVRLAREGIENLNRKYSGERDDIFFLFHRNRLWNPKENVWMGYERKRGKLSDLNATLRGAVGRFALSVGDVNVLPEVRFVITLDTDTQLPQDTACEMISAMAHILNRPVLDPVKCRLVAGYAIMQPRVAVSLPSSRRSWFVRIFGNDPGVDPYTRVVSDLYQDMFGEGSFIGKGIYDVDTFERHCCNFPENAILSHDLLESCHARSALLSDVILYEDYPSSYAADADRRHRWIRGDWQIAGWLLPKVRDNAGRRIPNPISALSRWKIFDNLRRSMVPVCMTILLLTSWIAASPSVCVSAVAFVVSIFIVPQILSTLTDLVSKPADLPRSAHLATMISSASKPFAQSLFAIVFLPFEAFVSLDAVLRTLKRVHWSKKHLLEWKTSSDSERATRTDLIGFYRSMLVAPVVAVGSLLWLWSSRPGLVSLTSPILLLWGLSPLAAWWLSRTIAPPQILLSETQRLFLRKVSRKTWRYFETFVTEQENWLPPDNVQTNPGEVIASRTSPTNIGMALLSDLAAYDFGYCSAERLLERTQNTFRTLSKMERYRGHFYNWYNTRTLEPLPPRYISTVDSGNLAGTLLVLRRGLSDLSDTEIIPRRVFEGLRDTLSAWLEEAKGTRRAEKESKTPNVDENTIRTIHRLIDAIDNANFSLSSAMEILTVIQAESIESKKKLSDRIELCWWAEAFERTCSDQLAELNRFAMWTRIPQAPLDLWTTGSPERIERMRQLREKLNSLDKVPTFREVAALPESAVPMIDSIRTEIDQLPHDQREAILHSNEWLNHLRDAMIESSKQAVLRIRKQEDLALECLEFSEMEFDFLYDKTRALLSIGYNVSDNRIDSGYYDLLASEARLASFILIAQGHLGQEHWFALGRLLTKAGGSPTLLSWSGSMFEYLMPLLVMPTYENTLLDQSYRSSVRRQIRYGRQRGVPWGISESGYNAVDSLANYQYRAFGVPGLGLKRGLAESLVIAPYASALALMVEPDSACRNLERLAADDRMGWYGFYEAIDYTPSRLPPGSTSVTVRQFMAHHAGMSLLSLAYVLLDKPMQRRFVSDPMFRAYDLLLHERIPKTAVPVFPHAGEAGVTRSATAEEAGTMRVFTNPSGTVPEVHLLSNGQYHVMVTAAGGGYSRWRDLAVTRWREDPTRDCWGNYCYLRDLDSGVLWSTTWHPTEKISRSYEAIFTQSRAEFRRQDKQIEAHTEISVSSENDIEIRRITLTNRSNRPRRIELTTYSEVVLAPQSHDESHPAFSNLFVQTEIIRSRRAILTTRRPRSAEEKPPWMIHMMTTNGNVIGEASFETDRMKFIGRGRSTSDPCAFDELSNLSDSEGSTLDPIVSIRQSLLLQPNESARVDIFTGVVETRTAAEAMADQFSDPNIADRVIELSWTRGLIMLRQLNTSEADAQVYGRLAGSVLYASSLRRAKASVLLRNRRGQSSLWGYGISGDLPIVVVRIRNHQKIELVRQAVMAHAYWRMKGLIVDLVIWNEDDTVYRQNLHDSIMDVVRSSPESAQSDRPGGVFVRRGEQMSQEDRSLLETVARVVLLDDAGTLSEQVNRVVRLEPAIPPIKPTKSRFPVVASPGTYQRDLEFFNGLGGFSRDGKEYVIILKPNTATPAPWVNVIANSKLGTVVSESGSAYTWAANSHEYRLTPWNNDPVSDTCGEAIYLRDEETGHYWSPSPLPIRGENSYLTRHGFGYSVFEYIEDGIETELYIYVDVDAAVKFARLKVTNRSGRQRQLSVTGYWEWVLGEIRTKTRMHVVTEVDPVTGAIFARNPYSHEFSDKVAFVDCSDSVRTCTGDRMEFLGRNGSPAKPAAMRRSRLSNRTGAGLDPCAALQSKFTLDDWQEKVIVFTIGAASGENEARDLVQRYRGQSTAQKALEGVWEYWNRTLGAVHVETPDHALNFLANGWLLYQTISCRMWGRSGFYQSGGAFGFRDQLQDAMALIHTEPGLLREHLLLAASRQFREGDVQHWWHPPVGRGVRTHFSDDYLWLPLAVTRYVRMTGDTGVLDEMIAFLNSRELRPDEEANYDLPMISEEKGSLYEHATRAIDHGLKFGAHGLPLMGCGDWNDGMNLVGRDGKGESVWLAFFLFEVLMEFSELARARGDVDTADRYTIEAERLRWNVSQHAWDGEWYRRAYFDDGTPLGSAESPECQIDSLSQSWSILSGAGSKERSVQAMEKVNERLVRRDAHLILLLDPPFDKSALNPGYIKGYVPGVRENGGQYTHGAIWTVMAFAELGETERAWELFDMINPVNHGTSPQKVEKYRVEPYVVAADVYGVEPHLGRGGWTWYTGSAGWMYRLITESLLGIQLDVDKLRFEPRPPRHWRSYKIHYRYHQTFYHILIRNEGTGSVIRRLVLDGIEQPDQVVALINDRSSHEVVIELE